MGVSRFSSTSYAFQFFRMQRSSLSQHGAILPWHLTPSNTTADAAGLGIGLSLEIDITGPPRCGAHDACTEAQSNEILHVTNLRNYQCDNIEICVAAHGIPVKNRAPCALSPSVQWSIGGKPSNYTEEVCSSTASSNAASSSSASSSLSFLPSRACSSQLSSSSSTGRNTVSPSLASSSQCIRSMDSTSISFIPCGTSNTLSSNGSSVHFCTTTRALMVGKTGTSSCFGNPSGNLQSTKRFTFSTCSPVGAKTVKTLTSERTVSGKSASSHIHTVPLTLRVLLTRSIVRPRCGVGRRSWYVSNDIVGVLGGGSDSLRG
eukprot:m.276857 g.276857  ORF g.276857 m.276857 type:complete len:318 (+) comp19771_c0_seq2:378-1331(+)